MERLVRVDTVDVEDIVARAGWAGVDGLELDLTGLSENEAMVLQRRLEDADLGVRSVHYGRTTDVRLGDIDRYRRELGMVAEQAEMLGAAQVSVAPPTAAVGEAHTVRDLQRFTEAVDAAAADHDVEVCLGVTGFLTDPQLVNAAFDRLDDPSLGLYVAVDAFVDGIDPRRILAQLDIDVWKLWLPVSVHDLHRHADRIGGDIVAVGMLEDTLP